jgi:hypothetical protein
MTSYLSSGGNTAGPRLGAGCRTVAPDDDGLLGALEIAGAWSAFPTASTLGDMKIIDI